MSGEPTGAGAPPETDSDDNPDADDARRRELEAELELLTEENRRLRRVAADAHRTRYRRTALGFAALGLLAGAAGLLFVDSQSVLFALGGTGLFAAVLVHYLTPERFIAAELGERVYETAAANQRAVVSELDLTGRQFYVPLGSGRRVRLFVPQHGTFDIPDDEDLERAFVVPAEERAMGVAFRPVGDALYDAFDRTRSGATPDRADEVLSQLADAVVESFELAGRVEYDLDTERATVSVRDPAWAGGRFDHPVGSLFAVGLARMLGAPVELETVDTEPYVFDLRWGDETSHTREA